MQPDHSTPTTTPSPSTPAPAGSAGKDPSAKEEKSRYRATLNLPQTPFAMKANLVQNEPASLARWGQIGVYEKLRERKGRGETEGSFTFHDGPPYANGSIHLGHLMNKCLKDFVVRAKSMQGVDCPYVPGWDCHGLPIEHKVMQELAAANKLAKLSTLTEDQRRIAVRRECQKHAEKYVKLHTTQMTRLLTLADYAKPYLTMTGEYEAGVLQVLATLLERGLVYRQLKPVHWSPANETALADAELEYQDREDPSVYVDFEAADPEAVYDAFGLPAVADDDEDEDEGDASDASAPAGDAPSQGGRKGDAWKEAKKSRALPAGVRPHQRPSFMIWTTTPWTLPANLAIAVNPRFEYALVWIDGNVTVVAKDAIERVTQRARSEEVSVLATTTGDKLVGLRYRHPFVEGLPAFGREALGDGSQRADVTGCYRVVAAEYVTLEDGTGLVHTAPGHGVEDYQTGLREKLPVYCPVRENGTYDDTAPQWLRGVSIWDANALVIRTLRESGHMFHDHVFSHSYPHDWRSKTPVIFRATEQWFVSVEQAGAGLPASLRDMGLSAVSRETPAEGVDNGGVRFVPAWGRNRLRGMLEARPDWCISRQRSWGLPIPAFLLEDGTAVMTPESVRAVAEVLRGKGSDAWYQLPAHELLSGYSPESDAALPADVRTRVRAALASGSLRKGGDILDVWFESGSSWYACMKQRGLAFQQPDASDAIDLYLEGSDQHRGWFQLSMLPALGVLGRPPFRTLLTHGFMVDRDGKKLSKSRPDAHRYEVDALCADFGMDVMRWWVSSLAYENDVKVDVELFALAGESYRKVRNTLRFLLSNLADFDPASDSVDLTTLPPTGLDRWVLAEFAGLVRTVRSALNDYDFQTAHKALFDFCNTTLSATYLAAVKDRLYCDAKNAPRRRATQTTIFTLTEGLCQLLAPFVPHTSDEAYRALHRAGADDRTRCVHLTRIPEERSVEAYASRDQRWDKVMQVVATAQVALEQAKREGIENPLDAGVQLPREAIAGFDPVDLADLLGVSKAEPADVAAPRVLDLRQEPRCERSWKRDGTVKQRSDGGMLSERDARALGLA